MLNLRKGTHLILGASCSSFTFHKKHCKGAGRSPVPVSANATIVSDPTNESHPMPSKDLEGP